MTTKTRWSPLAALVGATVALMAQGGDNLVQDPSFEEPRDRNPFGQVFSKWAGWKYEGDCSFEVGQVAHTGARSCLLVGAGTPKIRIFPPERAFEPGRYKVTAFIRGLDIGVGLYRQTTEFAFAGSFMPLHKSGTFGWTPLTYVGEFTTAAKASTPMFGLMAPGMLWVDDVTMEKVPDDTPLTPQPVLGQEEAPIVPPGELGAEIARCPQCAYRNTKAWQTCYACGAALDTGPARRADLPPVKTLASFEETPCPYGNAVAEHATEGTRALRLEKGYTSIDKAMDWSGYDLFKVDVYNEAEDPQTLNIELRDTGTRDYWTRVNYSTVVPPGASTLTIPAKHLYVGEKSRPGRPLMLNAVTRLAIAFADEPAAPLVFDHVRLETDDSAARATFDGLFAFDFGIGSSPVMDGFTQVTAATLYSPGRGYGLKDARIWRSFDALQPDPLYQDFVCIVSGGLAIDVPNGTYHVVVNIDSPSGYWGEYQTYTKRAVLAEGTPVVSETLTFEDQVAKYFRFWDTEDLPSENTFDKYQRPYFREKAFDVTVADGQLNIGFQGENWACCVSSLIVYPKAKAAEGARFLQFVQDRRRFYFDNYFKRVLAKPSGDPLAPTAGDTSRGYVTFTRDYMQEVSYADAPRAGETAAALQADAFAGEHEPVTLALVPLQDLGTVAVTAGDLAGRQGATIPASAIDVGYVSYRVKRVTMEGSVYTIGPRLIMPTNAVACPRGQTRRFWLTVRVPADAKPGLYEGAITVTPAKGKPSTVPLQVRVRNGNLDEADVPAGPWGYSIRIPWGGDDPAAAAYASAMSEKSLRRLRACGFTMCSGFPDISYKGVKDGRPVIDFARADDQMRLAKELGFLGVVTYGGGVHGIDAYYQDANALKASGLPDYAAFIGAVYGAVRQHADEQGWLPVFYNLCDEPLGNDLTRSAENAETYRKAFAKGPPFFTGASSYAGDDPNDPHFRLAKALHVANWNTHSEASVKLLHDAGSDWAFYNGGNRWTYGDYMYKAVKQFGMKFRVSWHWNVVAGDPYYALDCREDDYAWCNASPDGRLVPSLDFERNREGLDDYRRLLTLERLAKKRADTPAAVAARKLLDDRLASFRLGQRDHDALFGVADWAAFRGRVDDAIEALRVE